MFGLPHSGHLFEDWHGYSVPQAKGSLVRIFRIAAEKNSSRLYIVTGKGNHVNSDGTRGVLHRILPELLKSYSDRIEKIVEESSAYRIYLKHNPDFITKMLKEMSMQNTLDPKDRKNFEKIDRKAKNGDVESLLYMASVYISGAYKEFHDPLLAIEYYKKAAEKEPNEANFILGMIYLYGWNDTPCDPKEAKKYLSLAAEKDYADAQFQLGVFYLHGQAGYTDESKGRFWLEKAAQQKHILAMQTLADSYLSGDFTERNFEKAVLFLKEGVKAGYEISEVGLARCYASGQGVEKNLKIAFELYQKAAVKENIYALYQMGEYHSDDRVGKKNPEEAFKYYKKAADLGDNDARGKVAQCYIYGLGIERNEEEAFKLFQIEIDAKNPDACFFMALLIPEEQIERRIRLFCDAARWGHELSLDFLGESLLEQKFNTADRKIMIDTVLTLGKANNPTAQILLFRLYFLGREVQMDKVEANKWLDKAISKNSSEAYFVKGNFYFRDNEAPNRHLWVWYLQEAAKKGSIKAQMQLAKAFYQGMNVEKNLDEARKYLEMAAEEDVVEAQSLLGFLYVSNCTSALEEEKALKWLEKAAMNDDDKAAYFLSQFYLAKPLEENMMGRGFSHLNRLVKKSYPPALYRMGSILINRGNAVDGKALQERALQAGYDPRTESIPPIPTSIVQINSRP